MTRSCAPANNLPQLLDLRKPFSAENTNNGQQHLQLIENL